MGPGRMFLIDDATISAPLFFEEGTKLFQEKRDREILIFTQCRDLELCIFAFCPIFSPALRKVLPIEDA